MSERMNQQRDFAAPFAGCEQLNKSKGNRRRAVCRLGDYGLRGELPKAPLKLRAYWVRWFGLQRETSCQPPLEVLGLLENKVKQKMDYGKNAGLGLGPSS